MPSPAIDLHIRDRRSASTAPAPRTLARAWSLASRASLRAVVLALGLAAASCTPASPMDGTDAGDAGDAPSGFDATDAPTDTAPRCIDADGDGFGLNCAAGMDCDDHDAAVTDQCYRCLHNAAGCACTPGTAPVPCDLLSDQDHAAEGECHLGQRNCVDGAWGHCVAIGGAGVGTHIVQPPTACAGNCDPTCQTTYNCPTSTADTTGADPNIALGNDPAPVFCPPHTPNGGVTLVGGPAGAPHGGTACTGLCLQQVICPGTTTTTVTGTVYAPTPSTFLPAGGTPDPLYNATVYVPNAPVAAFPNTVSCDRCGAPASGSPLVSTTTGPDGRFTLTNVPVGSNIPLVIQLGRWRRQITIPAVAPCTNTALPATLTRLPRNHTEGDIPRMAMVTGDVDALECVLRKIGIDQSEFTVPTDFGGTGRVQFFINNGADVSGRAPAVSQLVGNASRLAEYDMVLFACQGFDSNQSNGDLGRVLNYANAGGRVFATHYSYNWLDTYAPFSGTAHWAVGGSNPPDPLTAIVDQSFTRGADFATWLRIVGASSTLGQVSLNQTRHDFNGVVAPSTGWLYSSRTTSQYLHYTFNTPVGSPSADQCGRVLFSDFHVTNAASTSGYTFPSECNNTPMTAQEKVLEFMLFDLASCIAPTSGVTCAAGETMCHTQCCSAGQSCMTTSTGAVCFQPYPATATFAQTVDASASCGAGEQVSWNNLVFVANAPAGTSIDITFYTAATSAGLATATGIPLGTYPATTSPIDLAAALTVARQSHNLPFAKVVFTLHSDSTQTLAPVLDAYQVNFNCAQST